MRQPSHEAGQRVRIGASVRRDGAWFRGRVHGVEKMRRDLSDRRIARGPSARVSLPVPNRRAARGRIRFGSPRASSMRRSSSSSSSLASYSSLATERSARRRPYVKAFHASRGTRAAAISNRASAPSPRSNAAAKRARSSRPLDGVIAGRRAAGKVELLQRRIELQLQGLDMWDQSCRKAGARLVRVVKFA